VKGEAKKALRNVIERYELPVAITANQNLILRDISPSWKDDILSTLKVGGWEGQGVWARGGGKGWASGEGVGRACLGSQGPKLGAAVATCVCGILSALALHRTGEKMEGVECCSWLMMTHMFVRTI
jgi:hypothetical protein